MLFPILESRTEILILDFSEFKDLLHSYSPSKLALFQEDYALKHSMLGKVAVERLAEQEKANKQLSQKSKELKRSFALAQSANIELEKKVAELADALKTSQDEKKIAEAALEQSKKEMEKVRKAHEDDLSLIENLREKHERATKIAEDLHTNNASLAKSLSAKDRKIMDLEKALAEQDAASEKNTFEILEKLKLLYEEYKKSLNEFGVRPAPLPDNIGIPEFMDWMETEFKALSEVISGASDFAAAFSVESILTILHDFDWGDLEKFRDKISRFPSATSTSILRANADVQAIKNKFAREFWLTSGKETVKVIARAKLAEVNFYTISSLVSAIDVSVSRIPFTLLFFLSQLNEEENRENIAVSPEGSASGKDSSDSGEGGSGGSSSSDEGSDDGQASGRDDGSPKVDVTN
jgi:myosin heavy subunit